MDTHDTNLPEKAAELEEEKKATEVSEPALTETPAEEATKEEKPVEAIQKLNKEEILAKLKEVSADVENAGKQEIDGLKQAFYKLHNAELEAAKKMPITFDADCPETTPERAVKFRRVNPPRNRMDAHGA